MNSMKFHVLLALVLAVTVSAFTIPKPDLSVSTIPSRTFTAAIFMSKEDGVVELADEETESTEEGKPSEETQAVAPFLSQGAITEEATDVDLSDPKQARVMFYIILSLIPVLFLIPLMLGSRELVPLEWLPPVDV